MKNKLFPFLLFLFKNIYDNIKNNELKFPEDDINSTIPVFGSDSTILKEGWLWKQGK